MIKYKEKFVYFDINDYFVEDCNLDFKDDFKLEDLNLELKDKLGKLYQSCIVEYKISEDRKYVEVILDYNKYFSGDVKLGTRQHYDKLNDRDCVGILDLVRKPIKSHFKGIIDYDNKHSLVLVIKFNLDVYSTLPFRYNIISKKDWFESEDVVLNKIFYYNSYNLNHLDDIRNKKYLKLIKKEF